MNRVTTMLGLLALLPATNALAQGGVPYNRGLDPASVRYEPRSTGAHEVSVELRMSNLTPDYADLSSVLTMRVNGALVGDPVPLPIEAGPLGNNVACRPNFCWTVCRFDSLCFNFQSWCMCISVGNHNGDDSHNRISMPTPPLNVGDVVELSLAAMPGGGGGGEGALPEIDTSDDVVSFVIQGTPCPADFDGDGAATSQDFFQFLTAFFNADPLADINGDGAVSSQDFFNFVAAFFNGC